MTVTDSYFSRSRASQMSPSLDPETLKSLYKFHKGTTYSIGAKGATGRNNSSAKDSFLSPNSKQASDKLPGRRNQEFNVNLKNNYQIGQNAPQEVPHLATATEYKRMVGKSGGNNPGKQYAEAQLKAKEFQQFINANKFEYGHDPNGGSRAGGKASALANSVNYKFDPKQMQSNKERAENQNFKIQPNRALQNSETKRIGDKIDSF